MDDRTLGDSAIQQAPDGSLSLNLGVTSSTALSVRSDHPGGATIRGSNTATTGTPSGVLGLCSGPGIFCAGVRGIATAEDGTGVRGIAAATTGAATTGVGGFTSSSGYGTAGVFGFAGAATGVTFGVHGMSKSSSGVGVQGSSPHNGVAGFNQTCEGSACTPTTGNAGLFATGVGGNILVGLAGDGVSWTQQFRVDSSGKGYFNGGTQVGGADFAESVAVVEGSDRYEPGDLLVVDPTVDRHLTLSSEPYSTSVAGIYSTRPGILAMQHPTTDRPSLGAAEVPVAIVGIVPCKVSAQNGPIRRGDLLVSSSTPGHAMRGSDRDRMLGAVVGKALGELRQGTGIVEVLVTLQ